MFSGRAKIAIVLLVTLVYRATSNMLQTSVPLYAKYVLHASDFTVSLIVAIADVAAILSLLYLGYSSIRVGKTIFLSLALTSICLPLFLVTSNILSLALVNLFVTFCIGTLSPLLLTAIVLVDAPGTHARNLTIFSAVLSLSLVLSPIYQSVLLAATNENLISSMLFFAPLVGAAAALFFVMRSDDRLSVARGKFEVVFVKDLSYWAGILAYESFSLPFIAILTFGGIFAKNSFGASYGAIEALFTVFFLTSLIVRVLLVKFSSTNELVMALSFSVMVIGLFLVGFSSSMWMLAFGLVLLGYSHGVAYPIGARHIADAVPREKLVAAFTVCTLIDDSISLVATPALGLIAQFFGLSLLFLAIEAPSIVIGAAYILIMRRIRRRNE
jgi:MFS family permease